LAPYVDFYKVASYELLWDELLAACAQTGKPVTLSTGMANLDEIAHAVTTLRNYGASDITLLHCVSAYPTPMEECNLSVIETLRNRFKVKVGWSDHSVSPAVISRAVHHWNASAIEFHLDLDGTGAEFKSGHCWLPDAIEPVINSCKNLELIDGKPTAGLSPSEQADRNWRADPSDGLRPLIHIRKAFSIE